MPKSKSEKTKSERTDMFSLLAGGLEDPAPTPDPAPEPPPISRTPKSPRPQSKQRQSPHLPPRPPHNR